MPRIHEMIESKFMKKEDAGDGITVTVKGVEKRDVGTESEPEQKWVLLTMEAKPLVLNSTNLALLEKALGSDDTDDWTGKYVVLFNDENVSFAGKLTGGIRVDVRQTKEANAQTSKPRQAPRNAPNPANRGRIEDMEDDIPFR